MTATRQLPDGAGHFEEFGGRFVPEALFAALAELEAEFRAAQRDPAFAAELVACLERQRRGTLDVTIADLRETHTLWSVDGPYAWE